MMNTPSQERVKEEWAKLETSFLELANAMTRWENALRAFSQPQTDRVALIRYGLYNGDKAGAFHLAQYLGVEEKMVLLPEWVLFAIHENSEMVAARTIIKFLPRNQLFEELPSIMEPLLHNGEVEDYAGVLDLYADLEAWDHFATVTKQASSSSDPFIQQLGQDAGKEIGRRSGTE
jgi:hypothetical protein